MMLFFRALWQEKVAAIASLSKAAVGTEAECEQLCVSNGDQGMGVSTARKPNGAFCCVQAAELEPVLLVSEAELAMRVAPADPGDAISIDHERVAPSARYACSNIRKA